MLFYKWNTYINSSLQHSDLVRVSHGKTLALIGDQKNSCSGHLLQCPPTRGNLPSIYQRSMVNHVTGSRNLNCALKLNHYLKKFLKQICCKKKIIIVPKEACNVNEQLLQSTVLQFVANFYIEEYFSPYFKCIAALLHE